MRKGDIRERTIVICPQCEQSFQIRNCYLRRQQVHCCSISCAYYYRLYNPEDKLGTQIRPGAPKRNKYIWMITKHGYIYFTRGVYAGQVLHRVVMEKHLGRKLLKRETVHHKDENKLNNNLLNLEVMSISEHRKEHCRLIAIRKEVHL